MLFFWSRFSLIFALISSSYLRSRVFPLCKKEFFFQQWASGTVKYSYQISSPPTLTLVLHYLTQISLKLKIFWPFQKCTFASAMQPKERKKSSSNQRSFHRFIWATLKFSHDYCASGWEILHWLQRTSAWRYRSRKVIFARSLLAFSWVHLHFSSVSNPSEMVHLVR